MKHILTACAVAIAALGIGLAQAEACTTTTFTYQGGGPLTAFLVDPVGTVSGEVDATGCDIGIYYDSGVNVVEFANIHGATQFGIVNNGANVGIFNNTIYDIGDVPLDGTQYGIGIYFAAGSAASGNIIANTIWNYQKNGIEIRGPLAHDAAIQSNIIEGQGPVDFIAQNGIEVGLGATNITIDGNIVTGNSYTGSNEAYGAGVLIYGGPWVSATTQNSTPITGNSLIGNDVGVSLFNSTTGTGASVTTPTRNTIQGNSIWDNAVTNTTGDTAGTGGYQAGIQDIGDDDVIKKNMICGTGYTPVTAPPFLYQIDTTVANSPVIKNNFCGSTKFSDISASTSGASHGAGRKVSP